MQYQPVYSRKRGLINPNQLIHHMQNKMILSELLVCKENTNQHQIVEQNFEPKRKDKSSDLMGKNEQIIWMLDDLSSLNLKL